jgi:hypothetical protein
MQDSSRMNWRILHSTADVSSWPVLWARRGSKVMPVVKKERPQFPDRQLVQLAIRKRKHAVEAPQAMKDYLQAQREAGERMAALRLLRLAQNARKETEESA